MKSNHEVALEEVLELMVDAVCLVDKHGVFVYVSPAFERIFGYASELVIGQQMLNFVYEKDKARTLGAVDTLIQNNAVNPQFENRWVKKDGGIVHILWSVRWSKKHQLRIAVAHDITQRKKMEEQLYHLASHDALTDLPNRALLLDRITHALTKVKRKNTHLAILFIDIDDFKLINDSLGHSAGDSLLVQIAERLVAVMRQYDTVGRLGGDEFLVLLTDIKQRDTILTIAEKIRFQFERPFVLNGKNVAVSPSMGVAIYPDNGGSTEQLIQYADQAMYASKKAGGNKVTNTHFTPKV